MGERIRAFDWSATPLGPPAQWPNSLKAAVQIMLNSRYPMFVWWTEQYINLYNDAYISVLGQRHPEALGRSAPEVWWEIWDNAVGPQAKMVLYDGKATWNEEFLLVMERNGYTEETYFTFSYSPVLNDEGGVGGVFCACYEDTERVVGARRLAVLRQVAATTTDAESVLDVCRKTAEVLGENRKKVTFSLIYLATKDSGELELVAQSGLPEGSPFAPRRIRAGDDCPWFPGGVRPKELSILRALERWGLPGGDWPEPTSTVAVLPLRETPTGFLVAGASPRRAFDEAYRGFFELLESTLSSSMASARAFETERQRAESLAELDRAKTAFFSNVSHELRTPLTLILAPLEDYLAQDGLSRDDRELLSFLHRNGLRLQKLVNTLLDFSRIEAGRLQAAFRPVDLATLTADLTSNFRSIMQRAGLTLDVDCPPLPEPVWVDPSMWEKIVLNLLSNAFKFTFAGDVRVSMQAVGRHAQLTVADSGPGIPRHERPRVFERFYRIEGSCGRSHEGSGIGLALVAELVRLHSGEIRIESEPERGARFLVTIPFGTSHLTPDQVRAAEAMPEWSPAGARSYIEEASLWVDDSVPEPGDPREASANGSGLARQGRILVVDDNADMRRYLRRILRTRYEVELASDGRQAIEMACQSPPDLVLTDVMMPGIDGFQLLRALRAEPRTSDIPVIFVSARAGEEARVEGMDAGVDDYLVKPFTARELVARVSAHLDLRLKRLKAAEAVRASEDKLRVVTASIPALIAYVDCDLRYQFVNKTYERWFGVPVAEILGTQVATLLGPHAAARVRPYMERALAGERVSFEEWLPLESGTRCIQAVYAPDIDEAGAVRGFAALVQDVSEVRKFQVAQRLTDERLRALDATRILAWELDAGAAEDRRRPEGE